MLIVIFLAALVKPKNDDCSLVSIKGWPLDDTSIIGELKHQGIGPNNKWIASEFYAENSGVVDSIYAENGRNYVCVSTDGSAKCYAYTPSHELKVVEGQEVEKGDVLYSGMVVNDVFYVDMSRILLVAVFLIICILVRQGNKNINKREVE